MSGSPEHELVNVHHFTNFSCIPSAYQSRFIALSFYVSTHFIVDRFSTPRPSLCACVIIGDCSREAERSYCRLYSIVIGSSCSSISPYLYRVFSCYLSTDTLMGGCLCGRRKDGRILLLGLDGVGKTSILLFPTYTDGYPILSNILLYVEARILPI